MSAHASATTHRHSLPGGPELHRTQGGFWRLTDAQGSSILLTDADVREMHRLSSTIVLHEGTLNAEGDLIRIEGHGKDDYRVLTNAPLLSPEWFRVETRPSWSSARAFVARYSGGFACPDLAEPSDETLHAWRARTGENGGIA